MPVNEKIHGYTSYAHPLAQIEAAETCCLFSAAMVADEWTVFFKDAPPDEDEVPSPEKTLDALVHTNLRFESMGPRDELDEGYWSTPYGGTRMDILLYGWAYQVLDALGIDARLFWYGLYSTELIFVPDAEGVAAKARDLLKDVDRNESYISERHAQEARQRRDVRRERDFLAKIVSRGEGPREKKPAIVDRIAFALRASEEALTPEEVAAAIRHKNPASIAAALHQIVAYKRPARLVGWIERGEHGRYLWTAPRKFVKGRA